MALALALKYRPKLFSDLIGQEAVSKTLSMALDKNRIVHAYLFSGLRGSGKTSSARIFARALQCEKGPISVPCGECDICKATLEGRNLDIVEIDAASNRSIDNIRDLIEQTKYAPAMARFKIFIIDEVHMLTKEAFNALLKTLEEPPQYVKFILATTDPLKLPATILSRTQHFRFKKIPHKSVVAHLKNILEKEEVAFEDGALDIIARSGSGSLRDTLTLADQAINYCDKYLTTQKVTQMLGVVDPKNLQDFFSCIIHNDEAGLERSLQILGEYECEMIIDEMSLFLKEALFSQNKDFPLLIIDRFLGILSQAKYILNLNPDGSFVLLLMSLKMREALKLKDIKEVIASLESKVQIQAKNAHNTTMLDSTQSYTQMDTQAIAHSLPTESKNEATKESIKQESLQAESSLDSNDSSAQIFETLKHNIFDRSLELGEVFERCVQFVSFENGVLTWQSNPNEQEKEILKRYWNVIKEITNQTFRIALQTHQEIKIANIKATKDSKESIDTPQTIQQQATQYIDSSTKVQAESSPSVQASSDLGDKSQNQATQSHVATQADSPNTTQVFLAENQELISHIKQNFGATKMLVEHKKNEENDNYIR